MSASRGRSGGTSAIKRRLLVSLAAALAVALPADALGSSASAPPPSGGGGLAPTGSPPLKLPPPPGKHNRGRWLSGVTITEYWPAPESWFVGQLVSAPGLSGKHRIDWLYSADGVSMQGEGIGLDGQMYHLTATGSGGWITAAGKPTDPGKGWAGGPPFWRSGGYWRNRYAAVTFPLEAGGWSAGAGRRYVPLRGVSFAPGPSLQVKPYQSIAVDPSTIPLGSLVYIPAYHNDGHGGWFTAADTGGAVVGRRIDVFRTPPAVVGDPGQYLTAQRVYVIKPA
jgi:3D (Asp-Asp-Asp) domain-containing protein